MSNPYSILVLGYGEHGKDEFAKMLSSRLGLKYCSSSYFACEHVIFPWFARVFPGYYETIEQCYEDRRNWRACWHVLISRYNSPDKSKLATEVLREHDIYIGMRCELELKAVVEKGLFKYIFWVDGSKRKLCESRASNSIHYDPTIMRRIDNNGDLEHLKIQASRAAERMRNHNRLAEFDGPRWPRLRN